MEKVSAEKALSFIDSWIGKVSFEKKAEESPITVKASDVGGNPAGTVKAKVGDTEHTEPEKTKTEEKAAEGQFAKEKSADVSESAGNGTHIESASAGNTDGAVKKGPATGDFGATDAGDGGQPSAVSAEKMKVAEESTMESEKRRAQRLGEKILVKVAELVQEQAKVASEQAKPAVQPKAVMPKVAEQTKTAEEIAMDKMAAEAYTSWVTSFKQGMMKRAEDFAAVKAALPGLTDAQIGQMLDHIAAEDESAVLPGDQIPPELAEAAAAEGGAAPEGEMPPEAAVGAEMPPMAPEGEIPPEATAGAEPAEQGLETPAEGAAEGESAQIEEAEKLLQDLIKLGIPPEAIEAAIQEINGEEGEAKAAAEAELNKRASELGIAPELFKQAAAEFEDLKGIVRAFRAGQLSRKA